MAARSSSPPLPFVNSVLFANLPFDPLKDFRGGLIGIVPQVVLINSVQATTLRELERLARTAAASVMDQRHWPAQHLARSC
jgi:hypothetical protein